MKKLRVSLRRLVTADSGVTAIEYGLLSAVVGVVLLGALAVVGSEMNTNFNTIATSFDGTKVEDDRAWPDDETGETAGEESDKSADSGGAGESSGQGNNGETAGSGDNTQTAGGRGERGIIGSGADARAARHAGADWSSGPDAKVNAPGSVNAGGALDPEVSDRDTAPGSAAEDTGVGEPGSYGTAAALLPPVDDGADESWALAAEKTVTAAQGKATEAAGDSGALSDVSSDGLGWIGLLVLMLAFALVAANFRRAARELESRRQLREWREAQAETGNLIGLHTIKPEFRKAA